MSWAKLQNNSIYRKGKKKKNQKKKLKFRSKLKNLANFEGDIYEFAKKVRRNPSKGEQWFHHHWEKYKRPEEHYNQVFMDKYIPDIINHKYKYIIEINGSIHLKEEVKAKDVKKRVFYRSKGYEVYTIIPFIKRKLRELNRKIELRIKYFNEVALTSIDESNKVLDNS